MGIRFLFPAALWLLAVLLPLWLMALAVRRQRSAQGLWVTLAIRSALIVALVLALAGMRVERATNALTTVFLLDRSASVTPAMRARADDFVRDALGALPADDRAAVVAFGAEAVVERAPGQNTSLSASQVFTNTATNIQEAMQLGMALLPAETGKRIVLISDGGENAGSAQAAAQIAASRNIPISYVDLGGAQRPPEAQVSELQAPANVRKGQSVVLTAVIESTVAQAAVLRIAGDGKLLAERNITLKAGTNRVQVDIGVPTVGLRRFRARVIPKNDTRAENNLAETQVQVAGVPKVLLVDQLPGDAESLRRALVAAKITADHIPAEEFPKTLDALRAYDVVVLVNVPATSLPTEAMKIVPAFVRDLGRGLVMIGGDLSFAMGNYGGTPIEAALPVRMDTPMSVNRPNIAISYVIDKSSSMSGCHCNGPNRAKDGYFDKKNPFNIDIAKQAVQASLEVLDPRDSVSVVMFDQEAFLTLPPTLKPSVEDYVAAVGPVKPIGGTNLSAGLDLAAQTLQGTNAKVKHIILFTDGNEHANTAADQAKNFAKQGITLSVVGEGYGNTAYLKQVAAAGNGRYIQVDDVGRDVPRIFLRETLSVVSKQIIEHPFVPRYASDTPILRGLKNGLPKLYGYNGTTPKQTALVSLTDANGMPVLAQWQYGLGRAVAWTSDTKGQWATDWLGWPQFPRFAAQLVGWTLPSTAADMLRVEQHAEGAQTVLQVTMPVTSTVAQDGLALHARLVAPDGKVQDVPLAARAPGEYHATVDTPPQGTYTVHVLGSRNGQVVAQGTGLIVVPYSPEFRIDQRNPALLDALARATGGTRLEGPQQAFAPVSGQSPVTARDLTVPLLLLALLLLPLDILARRLIVLWRTRAH